MNVYNSIVCNRTELEGYPNVKNGTGNLICTL